MLITTRMTNVPVAGTKHADAFLFYPSPYYTIVSKQSMKTSAAHRKKRLSSMRGHAALRPGCPTFVHQPFLSTLPRLLNVLNLSSAGRSGSIVPTRYRISANMTSLCTKAKHAHSYLQARQYVLNPKVAAQISLVVPADWNMVGAMLELESF